MSGKTVLVTGGSGFLGAHVVDALDLAGYNIRIFDLNPATNLPGKYEMIVGDITDLNAVMEASKGCDYIYHLAGIADIEYAKSHPVDTQRINIGGTLNILEAARINKTKRLVFSSTVYVYSDRGGFYRVSKQACENYIETYGQVYSVPYTILRYGSLYGPGAGNTNGIYRLIRTAIETGKVTYNGDKNAMREYIYVSDAAKLSVDILDKEYENQHVILTGNERMKVMDIMRMISEILPGKPELEFGKDIMAGHYAMTPYTYNPKMGKKLIDTHHTDLGQGLLQCIGEIYREIEEEEEKKKERQEEPDDKIHINKGR